MRSFTLTPAACLRLPALLVAASTLAQANDWIPVSGIFDNPTGQTLTIDFAPGSTHTAGLKLGYRIVPRDQASSTPEKAPDPELALPLKLAGDQALQIFYQLTPEYRGQAAAVFQALDDSPFSYGRQVLKVDAGRATLGPDGISEGMTAGQGKPASGAQAAVESKQSMPVVSVSSRDSLASGTLAPASAGAQTVPDTKAGQVPGPLRKRAKVKFWDTKKGYGFLIGEDGQDVFVHQQCIIARGFRALTDGEEVEYQLKVAPNSQGVLCRRAYDVTMPGGQPINVPDPRPRAKQSTLVLAGATSSPSLQTTLTVPSAETSSGAAKRALPRLRGTVKWFDDAKGFGFIKLDGVEEEAFVHQSEIYAPGLYRTLTTGEEVLVSVVFKSAKLRAVNVRSRSEGPVEASLRMFIAQLALAGPSAPRSASAPPVYVPVTAGSLSN